MMTLSMAGFRVLSIVLALCSAGAMAQQHAPTIPLVDKSLLLSFLADSSTFTLIDARSADEYDAQHINGAINVPHDQLDAHLGALPDDPTAPVVIYCRTGKHASRLREALLQKGYTDVRVLPTRQIFWNDEVMVFNCGTPDEGEKGAADNNIAAKR